MQQTTGAVLVAQALAEAGVQWVFTLSGNQVLALYDIFLDVGIKLLHTRHEAAAGHMADAWGRLTDRPGVFLVSGGPGHTNATVAAGVARAMESPVLWLSGSGPVAQQGRGAFQELDQAGLAATVCKAAWQATDPQALPQLLADALALATADPPGPVHVTLPTDIQSATIASADVRRAEFGSAPQEVAAAAASAADAETIVALLAAAERPLVLARPALGRGAAQRELTAFLAQTGIPGAIVESPRGLHDPAQPGLAGAVRRADVLLLLGSADFAVGFAAAGVLAPDCRLAQIASPNEPVAPTASVVMRSGARRGLKQVAAAAADRTWPRHDWWRPAIPGDPRDGQPAPAGSGIHPFTVCREVLARLGPDDCVALDGGEFGQWARLSAGAAGPQRPTVVLNGKFGSIGSAVPLALAAKLARPHARAIAFCGDGGFGYHALELDTALRYDLPILVVVGNDARWGSEWHLQVDRYGPDRVIATELLPTRYDRLARALGAAGELVESEADLPAAVDRACEAITAGRPCVLNVRIASLRGPAPSP